MRSSLARAFLRSTGWELDGSRPEPASFVMVAAPHTSNWDLRLMLAVFYMLGIRPAWLGKRELFREKDQPVAALGVFQAP